MAKSQQLQIRVTPEQKSALARRARRAGQDLSSFVLARVLPPAALRFAEAVAALGDADPPRHALAELNDLLTGLAPGQTILYDVRFQSLRNDRAVSAPMRGRFKTPAAGRENVRFLWTADQVGQGWGIHPDQGGMGIYQAMAQRSPDLFLREPWAVAMGGDPVQSAINRAALRGPRYTLQKTIVVKGAPVIEVYRRESVRGLISTP